MSSRKFGDFTTPKGTKLELINLKGKPYLQVAHRLIWLTEVAENYTIDTDFLKLDEEVAVAKAVVRILDKEGRLVKQGMATKSETKKGFSDFIEKSETGAIGRALAMLGFGTQFTGDELDEGDRLADAPVNPGSKHKDEVEESKPEPVAKKFQTRSRRSATVVEEPAVDEDSI